MSSDLQIPDGFVLIPETDHYALCESTGLVMNLKSGRALAPQWVGGAIRTPVTRTDGTRFMFRHDRIATPAPLELTLDFVLGDEGARIIPEFSRYAVTHYGLVYCIEPFERGPNAGRIHVVNTHAHQGHEKARLRNSEGKQVYVRIDKLLVDVWG